MGKYDILGVTKTNFVSITIFFFFRNLDSESNWNFGGVQSKHDRTHYRKIILRVII